MKERMYVTIIGDNLSKDLQEIFVRRPDLWGKSRNHLANMAWRRFVKEIKQTNSPLYQVKNKDNSKFLGTNGVTMGRYFNQPKLIQDPFVPEILHTPQELGLKKKEQVHMVTFLSKRFIKVKTPNAKQICVTEQIIIKLNVHKYSGLCGLNTNSMILRSNSERVGLGVFFCSEVWEKERFSQLGGKTLLEYVCDGLGIDRRELMEYVIKRWRVWLKDGYKDTQPETNSAKTFIN